MCCAYPNEIPAGEKKRNDIVFLIVLLAVVHRAYDESAAAVPAMRDENAIAAESWCSSGMIHNGITIDAIESR